MTAMEQMGKRAKEAAAVLAVAGRKKNDALLAIAQALLSHSEEILKENQKDLENGKNAGLTPSLLDRLALSQERIAAMAEGVRQVAAMPDPIGTVLSGGVRPNGLEITKVRVPLGVIGIIFEARPNVTSDAAALCLKAGNAKRRSIPIWRLPALCGRPWPRPGCPETASSWWRIHPGSHR